MMVLMNLAKLQGPGAAIIGGALFFLFLFLFQQVLLALLAALGGFVAGLFIFQAPSKEVEMVVEGISVETLKATLEEHSSRAQYIRELCNRMINESIKRESLRIYKFYQEILADIKKDPKDLKMARSFLGYYPDAVIKILERYLDLQRRPVSDPAIANSLARAEGMLKQIGDAFEKQLARLLQDDVLDLDTELELLRRTMQSEGLSD